MPYKIAACAPEMLLVTDFRTAALMLVCQLKIWQMLLSNQEVANVGCAIEFCTSML